MLTSAFLGMAEGLIQKPPPTRWGVACELSELEPLATTLTMARCRPDGGMVSPQNAPTRTTARTPAWASTRASCGASGACLAVSSSSTLPSAVLSTEKSARFTCTGPEPRCVVAGCAGAASTAAVMATAAAAEPAAAQRERRRRRRARALATMASSGGAPAGGGRKALDGAPLAHPRRSRPGSFRRRRAFCGLHGVVGD